MDIYNCFFTVEFDDHNVTFNRTEIHYVEFEPDYGCKIDVEFSYNYFVSGADGKRIIVSTIETAKDDHGDYFVYVYLNGEQVKTLKAFDGPCGPLYSIESEVSYCW